eukprot:16075217-Heterocapsa_arctica.AAC.1
MSITNKCCLAFSGLQSYRGRPPLSPSDAQRNVEPEKYNASRKSQHFGRTRLSGRALAVTIGCATKC